MTGMADRSEVSLTIAIVSLPVGGTMTRIACGRTIRRMACPLLMPRAWAASAWPCVDRQDAGAGDLGHVGRLGEPEADDAGDQGARELVDVEREEGEVLRQPQPLGELLAEGEPKSIRL